MKIDKINKARSVRRKNRTRKKLVAISQNVRLSVFRSNKYFYAQVIDDKKATTLVSVSIKDVEEKGLNKTQLAEKMGELLAQKAQAAKIKMVAFDKGSYRYHGRVKAFADGARKGGLVF